MRCGRAVAAGVSSAVAAATNQAQAIDARHRSQRRDRGAPAAAVRARFRVRAHLRWSWCSLAEKRDEICERDTKSRIEIIVPASGLRTQAAVPNSRFVKH